MVKTKASPCPPRRRTWGSLLFIGLASLPCLFLVALLLPLALSDLFISSTQAQQIQQFFDAQDKQLHGGKGGENGTYEMAQDVAAGQSGRTGGHQEHTDNWAVLIGASRFWFNYRVCSRRYEVDTIYTPHEASSDLTWPL